MDRTVPSRNNEEIALYLRTYYSLLRSSAEVQIRTLIEAHTRINSALHIGADSDEPDLAAFIYAILRMPSCLDQLRLVVMGQSEAVFMEKGFGDVESWQSVSSPARRRRSFFNGSDTMAVYIASRSDIDDMIPILTAYQIERDKLHRILSRPGLQPHFTDLPKLSQETGLPLDDLQRLQRIWGEQLSAKLLAIAQNRQLLSVQLLSGSLADYRRATRRWWQHVEDTVADIIFENRPVYFVSSNTHSMANMLSGFALAHDEQITKFVQEEGTEELQQEYTDILASNVPSSHENFLYYVLKKYAARDETVDNQREILEESVGIRRIPSRHVFDVEVQVVELARLRPGNLDPRLQIPHINKLAQSNALIINIDFPLGMAAYQLLSEISRDIASIRGVYIMGKAATLNGRIGDVMLPNVVHDEHSLNTYLFHNCLGATDVAPHLVYGTVLDNQKAITVRGTFLQNEQFMSVFYHEGYTDMEMEAGPYLSSIYEMIRPQRYPTNELVTLYNAPFPIGIVHYASDTPMSKGKNLGAQNLSYFGMDPTYASMVAILRSILQEEVNHFC